MTTFVASMGRERLYKASPRTPEMVQVPAMSFVMVDGHGDPNTAQQYKDAIQALYSVSYTLKFALKKERGLEYRVGPLEGLWWAEDMADFGTGHKGDWDWTAMIGQPDDLTAERFEAARQALQGKKDLPALALTRLERFEEGTCAQILHIWPYGAESPTIERLHEFIRLEGYRFDGRFQKHHEIYLSDPRRSPPERWKTIIRQPMSAA
jgi:hypothetical protein